MKKSKKYFYVSYYEDYPIYEPAEGGYYYAGRELIEYYRVGSLKRAKSLFKKLVTEYYLPENGRERGEHIGDARMLRIETVPGVRERGYVPYE